MKVLRGIAVCTLGMFLLVGVRLTAVSERDSDKKCGGYLEKCDTNKNGRIGVCTSLPTTPHLVVGRSACRVGVGPSLNRSWAQRSRPVVQAGRRAFPGDESVVD